MIMHLPLIKYIEDESKDLTEDASFHLIMLKFILLNFKNRDWLKEPGIVKNPG